MRFARRTSPILLTFLTLGLAVIIGCGGTNTQPSSIVIELPDGTSTEAQEGAGAPSLANSVWDFIREGGLGQDITFVRIHFNADGGIDRFTQSSIAFEVFGDQIIFDGGLHDTNQQDLQYTATSYGAGTSDGSGFAVDGRLTAQLTGLVVGVATVSISGTFDPADPDVITGNFAYRSQLTIPLQISGAEQDESFAFHAVRVVQ